VVTMKMAFVISAVVQVQKESTKVFRTEQTAKCAKATSMLRGMMVLKYVQFVMVRGKKVINHINIVIKRNILKILVILNWSIIQ